MTRKIDYLFLRNGSRNWYVRLQGPERAEKSLGTSDRAQAEILALPYIQEHKMRLLEARPGIQVSWRHRFAPGQEHITPDGERIVADDRELIFLNHNGAIVRKEPNGEFAVALPPLREQKAVVRREEQRQRTATSADDALIETYLKHKNVTGYYEREARAVWALYKQLTNGKPLKDASRDDGRKLVDYYEKQDLKSATIQKKVGWLTAAVNLAIDEATLKFNPFSSIVPERDDKQRRLPLNEADIRNVKQNLDQLDEGDQLLFRVLASTGMRLSEAFEIDGEMEEGGRRYVIVGRKTPQSLRRVPLPAAVLPFLPRKIEGRLFPGDPRAASKRLNRFLNGVGIEDRRKVVHSLRHRAQDRLRAAGCPEDLRWAILGHEQKTVAAGYGEGFPVPLLKRWIDKIGF
ncbi:site-specific integrase [Bradyrhizobium sp. AZCC 2289]|uniref:site-specific integrase n=1 Tax=Bradyrhizobium sp. AZCC 2289 TaxID=3117026 RepID=UPI002FF18339